MLTACSDQRNVSRKQE